MSHPHSVQCSWMDWVHSILSRAWKWDGIKIMKLKPWFTYVIHLSQNARGDGDSLTFNLEPQSIFYEVLVIHTNSVETHDTVTPELLGLRTLLVPDESGLFPAWEMFSLIRLCFDHLENGAGEEHLWEEDSWSGPGSFAEQQFQRDLQSATWNEWVHGGIVWKLVELNVGHWNKFMKSWRILAKFQLLHVSLALFECIFQNFGGAMEMQKELPAFFLFIYFFIQVNKFLVTKVFWKCWWKMGPLLCFCKKNISK